MSPHVKISLYILFIVVLFLVRNIYAHLFIAVTVLFSLPFLVPYRRIKGGFIPILLFLLFTFGGNLFFHSGRIIFETGFISVSSEGLNLASVRTLRVFSMIFGAKILTASLSVEEMVHAMAKMLGPLGKIGIPVGDFFSLMGLTLKSFPALMDHLSKTYREDVISNEIHGFRPRAKHMVSFLMPVFVKSMHSPESFFESEEKKEP